MDHAEAVAQRLFERVVVGARMEYHLAQSKGEHDFDLHHADGRVSAVEVTSSVNKSIQETYDAILNKGGAAIRTDLCRNSWCIHPCPVARINRIRQEADKYLAAIEAAGIERFLGPTDHHPSVEAIYRDLGVFGGSAAAWVKKGHILIGLPAVGGAYGVSSVIEAAELEAFKTDNRRKLGASRGSERHLAIYVYMITQAWSALVNLEPPPAVAQLPPEITDIWVFSEAYEKHEYVAWRGGALLQWQKLSLRLN